LYGRNVMLYGRDVMLYGRNVMLYGTHWCCTSDLCCHQLCRLQCLLYALLCS
jgi:hypothetical protein